jgi:hypothetical protein
VSGKAWWVVFGIGVAGFLFYLGGSYSFAYTHVCARSHQKTVFIATPNNAVGHKVTVCDAYGGNSKHWSPGDTFRAIGSERPNRWEGGIFVAILLAIGAGVFYDRWKRGRSKPAG